jgi:putative tricarboxylic transport membrane protein
MKEKNFPDLIAGLLFTGIAIAVFLMSNNFVSAKLGLGAGGYPRTIAVIMFVLGIIMTAKSLAKGLPRPNFKIDKDTAVHLTAFLVVTIVYLAAMRYIGFLFLTPFYLFGAMLMFGHKKPSSAAIISIASSIVIYFIFTKVFMVFLPEFSLF